MPDAQGGPPAPDPQILTTKLRPPRPRQGALRRPALLARLDAALRHPLALLSAPAGFGKTTLLAQWAQEAQSAKRNAQDEPGGAPGSDGDGQPLYDLSSNALRFAWLALDPGDDDPATFVRYLVGAVRAAGVTVGAGTLALLEGPPAPPATLLVPLLNELAELPGELALILDDYHTVATPAVHEVVGFMIERLPARLRLVIAGRADPPLPLARLRARGQLAELRAADLRFTQEEAGAFLRGTMGLALPDAEVARLEARTEGWAAALQLAGLVAQSGADGAPGPAGGDGYLFDYLAEEVFDRLPEQLRAFLLQTCILDRLSPELCDAVRGPAGESSRATLAELERRQLFVIPLDGERRWYRYHQLFAEALRERLRASLAPGQVAELYRRAAQAEPAPERAIAYLLEARLWDEAAARIEAAGAPLLAQGHTATVARWVEALPTTSRAGRPGLLVLLGLATARAGEIERGGAILADAAARCRPGADDPWRALALTELTVLALIAGDLPGGLERIGAALEVPAPPPVRSFALMAAVGAHTIAGRRDLVAGSARELFALLGGDPDSHLRANVLGGALSLAVSLFDQLGALEDLCRAGLDELGDQVSLARVGAEAGLAHIAWLRGRLDEALAMSERARRSSARLGTYGYIQPQMESIAGLAAFARGRLEAAGAHFQAALRTERGIGLYDFARPGQLYALARVQLQRGRLADARAALAQMEALPDKAPLGAAARALLAGALALAEADLAAAEALLAPLAAREDEVGLLAVFGSARPLLARLEIARGRPAAAAAAMAPLLAACARDGTPGRLLLEGPAIEPTLRLAAAHGVETPLAEQALGILSGRWPEPAPASPLAEPLSGRELDVLRLLAAGRSNRAIAEELTVTVGTAKRHVSNLMGKLGATSRLEAVALARGRGLI